MEPEPPPIGIRDLHLPHTEELVVRFRRLEPAVLEFVVKLARIVALEEEIHLLALIDGQSALRDMEH